MPNYNQNVTRGLVVAYLIDATHRKRKEIEKIVDAHKETLSVGVRCGNFASYVGDQIAQDAGLEFRDDFDPDSNDCDEDE